MSKEEVDGPGWREIVKELAELSPIEYDLARKEKAEEIGCGVSALDKEVEQVRGGSGKTEAHGRGQDLYEPEPWGQPVDGHTVLNEAVSAIKRHMVIRAEDAEVCALWAAHRFIYNLFDHTPRLLITAPAAECGKTVLMTHMVGNLVNKPKPVELMKPAPFFRLAEAYKPTDSAVLHARSFAAVGFQSENQVIVNAGYGAVDFAPGLPSEDAPCRRAYLHYFARLQSGASNPVPVERARNRRQLGQDTCHDEYPGAYHHQHTG